MIENIIYISNINDLKHFAKNFKRIYFGVEFCGNLLPSVKEVKEVLKFCRNKKVNFSLVLPWCSEKTVYSAEKILKILPQKTEVIFNDWGLWKLMEEKFKYKNFKYVLGRILCRIKSDPRVLYLIDKKKIDYAKQCVLNNVGFQRFIVDRGINQVELSNTFQGYNFHLNYNISTTIYYPYVFSSVTAFCIFKKNVNIEKCEYNCKNKYLLCQVTGKELNLSIFIRGNYEFYKNDKLPFKRILSKWHMNRIVFMPCLTL